MNDKVLISIVIQYLLIYFEIVIMNLEQAVPQFQDHHLTVIDQVFLDDLIKFHENTFITYLSNRSGDISAVP